MPEILADGLRRLATEEGGDEGASLSCGWRVLQMHADLCAPAASRGVEVHRSCGDDVGSGKRAPREHLVLDLVDDLGVPLDGQPGGPGGHPMRRAVGAFCHAVEVRHELRQILEPTPEPVDVCDRDLQPNRFPNMDAAIAAEGGLRAVGLDIAVQTSGQRPVIPRYSSGADATARQAPIAERREAPTSRSNAPAPSASQFSASASVGERSFRASASIDTVDKARCVPPQKFGTTSARKERLAKTLQEIWFGFGNYDAISATRRSSIRSLPFPGGDARISALVVHLNIAARIDRRPSIAAERTRWVAQDARARYYSALPITRLGAHNRTARSTVEQVSD